jgi:hypothetical protein
MLGLVVITSEVTMRTTLLVLLLCLGAAGTGLGDKKQPARPPSQMTVSLPDKISLSKEKVPMKLTFVNEAGQKPKCANSAFAIILLDENGKQVKDPFIREAVAREVVLEGRTPEYEPPLAFNRQCKGLQVGKQYQLVCVLPTGGIQALAGSARFTLTLPDSNSSS